MLASKPSIELDSCKIVLGICVMDSCVFLSMEHICDRNWLIKWTRIKLDRLLVTPSNLLYQTLIVRQSFYLQWHHDRRIQPFLLRSKKILNESSHGIFERLCIHIQYISVRILSYCIIARYHRLLLWLLRLYFYLQ